MSIDGCIITFLIIMAFFTLAVMPVLPSFRSSQKSEEEPKFSGQFPMINQVAGKTIVTEFKMQQVDGEFYMFQTSVFGTSTRPLKRPRLVKAAYGTLASEEARRNHITEYVLLAGDKK